MRHGARASVMRRCAQLVALALCSSVRSQTPALWVYRKNMSAYLLDDIGRIKLQFPVGSVHTVSIQVEKPQCGEWLIWLHGIVAVRHPRQRSACFCSTTPKPPAQFTRIPSVINHQELAVAASRRRSSRSQKTGG